MGRNLKIQEIPHTSSHQEENVIYQVIKILIVINQSSEEKTKYNKAMKTKITTIILFLINFN